MKTKDFDYNLPEELIAQTPIKDREESKLLVLNRKNGEIEHKKFKDIIEYFNKGDCLVLNNTKVMAARIYGHRPGKDEKIEILLLKRVQEDIWEVMVRPGKKARPGHRLIFKENVLEGEIKSITETGTRHIEFKYEGIFNEIVDELGEMPLPPYIKERLEERDRYQTVYSKHIGSSAAPTAGLHFTEELLKDLENKGVKIAYLTLHVGLGTFSPVKVDDVKDHNMHTEFYSIDEKTAELINKTKENGGKIISVGTTSTRTLESVANDDGVVKASSGWTDIFIYPGYSFKVVDEQITNFHLPESTLMMLVSAFANREQIMKAYELAIEEKYRFFSFGDAMYIR